MKSNLNLLQKLTPSKAKRAIQECVERLKTSGETVNWDVHRYESDPAHSADVAKIEFFLDGGKIKMKLMHLWVKSDASECSFIDPETTLEWLKRREDNILNKKIIYTAKEQQVLFEVFCPSDSNKQK